MLTNFLMCKHQEQNKITEQNKIESLWHGFLRKMVTNGFKRKNVSEAYLNAQKKAK